MSGSQEQPLIFQQFKDLAEKIPWLSLGQYPTPVERLSHVEKELGLSNLWIKRDDLSGELYGGNKVRTLEFCLAEAKQKKAEVIYTYSALGSNWPLACVIYAKLLGWPTEVFFLPFPLDSVKQQNLEVTTRLARRVHCAKARATFPFVLYSNWLRAKRHANVYLTPPGGASAMATLAYVNAVLELKDQCDQGQTPVPDFIFCPLGSGGTVAGISIGLHLIGWPTTVIAVRVVAYLVANHLMLQHLISRTVKVMQNNGARLSNRKAWGSNIRIEHDYFGKGYGKPTRLGERSIELVGSLENQRLDSTYTGKTFAAILQSSKDTFLKNKSVLFWQTLNSRNLDTLDEKLGLLAKLKAG